MAAGNAVGVRSLQCRDRKGAAISRYDRCYVQDAGPQAEYKAVIKPHLVIDHARPTTRKLRFVSAHYSTHLLRADWENPAPIGPKIEDALIAKIKSAMPRAGAVVLSDYAKGILTPKVIR